MAARLLRNFSELPLGMLRARLRRLLSRLSLLMLRNSFLVASILTANTAKKIFASAFPLFSEKTVAKKLSKSNSPTKKKPNLTKVLLLRAIPIPNLATLLNNQDYRKFSIQSLLSRSPAVVGGTPFEFF